MLDSFSEQDKNDIRDKARQLVEFYPHISPNGRLLLAVHKLWEEKWIPAGRKPDTKKPRNRGLFD